VYISTGSQSGIGETRIRMTSLPWRLDQCLQPHVRQLLFQKNNQSKNPQSAVKTSVEKGWPTKLVRIDDTEMVFTKCASLVFFLSSFSFTFSLCPLTIWFFSLSLQSVSLFVFSILFLLSSLLLSCVLILIYISASVRHTKLPSQVSLPVGSCFGFSNF